MTWITLKPLKCSFYHNYTLFILETQCRDEMPIKPGMLMRLSLNRGLERTQIPVEFIWYNPSSLFCFQMYNNISIKISRHRITTKISNVFDSGIWLKKLYAVFQLGNLAFIVCVLVRLRENFVGVWCLCQLSFLACSCRACVMEFDNTFGMIIQNNVLAGR